MSKLLSNDVCPHTLCSNKQEYTLPLNVCIHSSSSHSGMFFPFPLPQKSYPSLKVQFKQP